MNTKNHPNLKSWGPSQFGYHAALKPSSKNVSAVVRKLLDQGAENGLYSEVNPHVGILRYSEDKPHTDNKNVI